MSPFHNNNLVPANLRRDIVGLNSLVEDSPFVLSLHIPDYVIFLSEAIFSRLKAVFFQPRT